MCYAPIQIKNNSKLYRPLISKDFVTVPCGKCRECMLRKENDWFVRIYYEWLRTTNYKGQVFFVSMGYNDDHLPYLDTTSQEYSCLAPLLREFYYNTSKYRLSDEDLQSLRSRVERYRERYDTVSLDIPSFQHACFDDNHIVHFFKALRQYLNADGKLKYDDLPLKYFCVTEYGDNKHRPHYHTLIFVPVALDAEYFLTVCRKSWSYRVPKDKCPRYVLHKLKYCKQFGIKYCNFSTPNGRNWCDWHIQYQSSTKRYIVKRQFGFANYSKDKETGELRPVIEDVRGCKYLTSYLNYYDNYLKELGFDRLKDWLKLFPHMADVIGYQDYVKRLQKIKLVFPFKRVSQNFGSLYYEQLICKSQDELLDILKKNEVVIPNELQPYPIPSYIVNRLNYQLCDVEGLPNKVSFFTPLGYQCFVDTFDDKLFQKRAMYAETLQVLRTFLKKTDLDNFRERFDYDISIVDSPAIDFSISQCALFDVVLNGVSVSHMGSFIRLDDMSASQIIDNCYDIYINQLILRTNFLNAPEVLFDDLFYLKISNQNYLKERCYNALPQFEYYDKFLTVIHYIRKVVLERDAQKQKDIYTQTTRVREALNSFIYKEN